MRIALGSDHAGYYMKQQVNDYLRDRGVELTDLGTHNNEPTDYPEIAVSVAQAVIQGRADRGILICGSGEGMFMVANRFRGIRAALATSIEDANLSRRHDDANVLCLGGRLTSLVESLQIVDAFLGTEFEGGHYQRQVERIDKVTRSR